MTANLVELMVGVVLTTLDIAAIARAVWRSHGVERTLAWILAILAFPGFGAALYLLMASPSIKRTTFRKRAAADALRGRDSPRSEPSLRARPEPDAIVRMASRVTGLGATVGNRVELLAESDQAFAEIESAIRAAHQRIYAEYYLIRRDETGHRFLDLLAERARAGIEVKLLYDGVGSIGVDARRVGAIRAAGGRAEVFLPLNPFRRRWSVHLRNHRKLVAIDGQVGFTGGMNVGDEYSGRARRRGGLHFKDSHLALHGPAVGDLEQVFLEDWAFATEEELAQPLPAAFGDRPEDHDHLVAVLPSGPDQDHNASALVYFAGVASARRRAFLTSPYFIPDEPMVHALLSAALRGVDVRILVPKHPDVALVGAAARSYFPALLRSGVLVFEYLPAMLHAKTMVIDGAWGMVGSANLDIRSFRLNFELGAIVVDPDFAAGLEDRFRRDQAESEEVRVETLEARGIPARLRDGAARLLSPIL